MLKKMSVSFYKYMYGKGIYEEPMTTFLPIVKKNLVDKKAPKRILDAACGYNNIYLGNLLEAGEIEAENLVGMDIDNDVIDKNKFHHDIRIQDLHLPVGDNEFDAVISLYTWEHLQDANKVLKNFHDALKENGTLIIIAPQRYYYISVVERMLPQFMKDFAWRMFKNRKVMPYPAFFQLCTKKSLENEAQKVGFNMLTYRAIDPTPIWFTKIPPLFILMCFVMSMFNKFDVFEHFRGSFVTVLVKR